jgi:hypothetical protein
VAVVALIALSASAGAALAAPPAPTPLQPTAGGVLIERGVTFSWSAVTDPGGQPVHYEFYVYRPAAPDEMVAGALAIDPTGTPAADPFTLLAAPLDSAAEVTGLGGSVSGGVTFGAGRHGQAALVAGAEVITFPGARFAAEQGTVELAARLNRDLAAITGFDRFFTYHVDAAEGLSLLVAPQLDAVYGHVMHGGRQYNAIAPVGWTAGAWHHLAFTWGPEGERLYLDGVLAASAGSTAAPTAGGPTLQLGNDASGGGGIDAWLDDVRISRVQRRAPAELQATTSEQQFLESGAYEWRVRAWAPGDPGPWSAPVAFTVDASAPRRITVGGAARPTYFHGFGAEWDAMFLQAPNVAAGVTDSDLVLAGHRLNRLGIALVRMFVRIAWWKPTAQALDLESPEMQSVYRQLDVLQTLGIPTILVVWRGADWLLDWRADPQAVASATADLVKELNRRGYGIPWLTVVNEPNLEMGEPFDDYATLVRAVRAELERRALWAELVGPDESGGASWFQRAVPGLADTLGVFDSHSYDFDYGSVAGMDRFVSWRRGLLDANGATAAAPFFLAEFGSANNLDAFHSADIDTFERGLFSAEGALRAMAAGADAVAHWCLHDMYYDEGPDKMGYGLWRFRDEGWTPRPIYYAWSLLGRVAERGGFVHRVQAGDPRLFATALERSGGLGLWIVNRDTREQRVIVDLSETGVAWSFGSWEGYRYVEDALPTGDEVEATLGGPGGQAELSDTLPPRSLTAYFVAGYGPAHDGSIPPGPDAGTDASAGDAAPGGGSDGGCGCRATGAGGGGGELLVLVTAAAAARRRARRGARAPTPRAPSTPPWRWWR